MLQKEKKKKASEYFKGDCPVFSTPGADAA